MIMVCVLIFCAVLVVILAGSLKLRIWNSQTRLINAGWLDSAEKSRLLARWGGHL